MHICDSFSPLSVCQHRLVRSAFEEWRDESQIASSLKPNRSDSELARFVYDRDAELLLIWYTCMASHYVFVVTYAVWRSVILLFRSDYSRLVRVSIMSVAEMASK
jgi:hypothetical protein